jgi:two-component system sensor histidine kinase AdeS
MKLGLRNWLLAVAGVAAIAALVTLILYFIGLEMLAEWDARSTLGPDVYDRLMAGEVVPEAMQTLDEIYLFYLSYWFMALGFLIAFVVAAIIGWLGANPLLCHVTGLRNTAASVRDGNLAARVPNYRASAMEIERFSRDFNMLIARVERAERESRESAAALAHELRTPLTVISGRLQGMLDGVFPSDRSGLELLQRQVELLNRLVEDLRFLTLFETGRMAFHTKTLALDDLIRKILVAYPGVTSALAPLQVQGDPERLTQAIVALLDNAQRHAGGADLVELVQEGHEAVLHVFDQGPGISESEAQRVFDRFFRVEGSVGDGSGLGLSVVRAVVRGHGGTVHIRARPEGGSVFEIRLALHEPVVSTKSP